MKTFRLMFFVISLLFCNDAIANDIIPYGKLIEMNGESPEIFVSITKVDTAYNPIGPVHLFSGRLHVSTVDNTKATIDITKFYYKFDNHNHPVIQKLRTMTILSKGDYSIIMFTDDGSIEKFRVNIKKSAALIEIITTDDVPVFEPYQLVARSKDASVKDIAFKNMKALQISPPIELSDLE